MRPRSLVLGLVLALAAGVGVATPALAAGVLPDAPTVTAVTGGQASGQLAVAYAPPTYAGTTPISAYEVSLNGGADWFTCAGLSGVCPLGNLVDGRPYSILLRAVNAAGPGPSTLPATGTPSMPPGTDPAKPATLPTPSVKVGGTFTGAGNNLGVTGSTMRLGVGTLPKLRFTRAIPDKAVVEKHLAVTATIDATGVTQSVPGAWGWLDDRTVVFRPKSFWPGHATVTITSDLFHAVLGQSGKVWLVGGASLKGPFTFQTDRSLVAKVDGKSDRMKVYVDGKKVKNFPVSLGQKDWETRNGVKVISTDKLPTHTYTSAALDITAADDTTNPDYYELKDVPWNTRLTPTGEFLHAAPWALGRLGRWNGSHGCTNMTVKDAKWMYTKTIPGDVVTYTNTGGSNVEPNNGPGGLWNIPWAQWLKKSALTSVTGAVDTQTGSGSTANLPGASA